MSSSLQYPRRTRVLLNVYDLIPSGNDMMYKVGLGVFHSGVEIDGMEWSFGFTEQPISGVFAIPPRSAPEAKFREAVDLGEAPMSSIEVRDVIDRMSREYLGTTYSLLSRNCNHFSDDLLRRLGFDGVPRWVNRMAFMGTLVQCVLPAEMGGRQVPAGLLEVRERRRNERMEASNPNNSVLGGMPPMAAPGTAGMSSSSTQPVERGEAGSSNGSGNGGQHDAVRERAMQAALRRMEQESATAET